MNVTFAGRTALVTGATRGIGARIADDLEEMGATLLLTGTDPTSVAQLNREAESNGRSRRYVAVDFTDHAQTETFLDVVRAEPKVDVLVNNAGINRINPIDRSRTEDWEDIRAVNLDAPVALTRIVAAIMRLHGYGRIVNIGSVFGVVSRKERAFYSTTKFGLLGLTTATALDLGRDGVLVNMVSPGFVDTDLTRRVLGEEGMRSLTAEVPVGRLAQPEDISRVVAFLASELNTYITGQNVVVDGGFVCA